MDKVSMAGPGITMFLDERAIMAAYGSHGVKVSSDGDIEVLMLTVDSPGWHPIEDVALVQIATPTKARKN